MRDATPRHWHRWRITPAAPPASEVGGPVRLRPAPCAPATGDGIRHELVARVRAEIAAGTYDTEEKWLAAEAALLHRVTRRT